MQTKEADSLKIIYDTLNELSVPYYREDDFYIFLVLSLLSLVFSGLAFFAARGAKEAALEASKSVKVQTVTLELYEISIKLDRLDDKITYFNARDLINEISRRIIRLLSNVNYIESEDFKTVTKELTETLDKTKKALKNVEPSTEEIDKEVELESVYFAIEDYFYSLSNLLAQLIGILERTSLDLGEK